jgi:hypothetical protein
MPATAICTHVAGNAFKDMERILLSTFLIKIQDNNRNDQILSHFNGTTDFLNLCRDYLTDIFSNIQNLSDSQAAISIHLTLEAPATVDLNGRTIHGYFSSGVGGEEYAIRDVQTRNTVLDVRPNHAAFRNLFFYFYIPRGSNVGALVLQRKSKYGIKTILKKSINEYSRAQGYSNYKIHINNVLHGQVFRRMMDNGSLKKIDFVKRTIPSSIEAYFQNNGQQTQIPGTLKTTFLSASSLPQAFKQFIERLYQNTANQRIEIDGIDEEFDEVEFELELNGKKKTFYVSNRTRIQPDVDVTRELDYGANGQPTTESLIRETINLLNDIINMGPRNVIPN